MLKTSLKRWKKRFMNSANKYLRVKLVRSTIKVLPAHKSCVRGLGLRTLGQVVEVRDTRAIRGMINKVIYLLHVEECSHAS